MAQAFLPSDREEMIKHITPSKRVCSETFVDLRMRGRIVALIATVYLVSASSSDPNLHIAASCLL